MESFYWLSFSHFQVTTILFKKFKDKFNYKIMSEIKNDFYQLI